MTKKETAAEKMQVKQDYNREEMVELAAEACNMTKEDVEKALNNNETAQKEN